MIARLSRAAFPSYSRINANYFEYWHAEFHGDLSGFVTLGIDNPMSMQGGGSPEAFLLHGFMQNDGSISDFNADAPQSRSINDFFHSYNHVSIDGVCTMIFGNCTIGIVIHDNNNNDFHAKLFVKLNKDIPPVQIQDIDVVNGINMPWDLPIPSGKVTGYVMLGKKKIVVKANGFYGHQWGNFSVACWSPWFYTAKDGIVINGFRTMSGNTLSIHDEDGWHHGIPFIIKERKKSRWYPCIFSVETADGMLLVIEERKPSTTWLTSMNGINFAKSVDHVATCIINGKSFVAPASVEHVDFPSLLLAMQSEGNGNGD